MFLKYFKYNSLTSGTTKTPQDSRVKEIHYGVKRKSSVFWEKFKLSNSLKQKVKH